MPLHRLKQLVPNRWRERYWNYVLRRNAARREHLSDQVAFGKSIARSLWRSQFLPVSISSVLLPGYQEPLYYRPRTSDVAVIRQVFKHREYQPVAQLDNIQFIVDGGANIGCTSYFLLHAYPNARAIVVEPDKGNMEICKRNLAYFSDRVTFIEAGIWSDDVPLKVARGDFRDGKAWSFQVRPCAVGESPDFLGVTIGDILNQSGFERIDLLKIDIEAAEKHVFASSHLPWLAQTANLAIELHDEECRAAFDSAMRSIECTRTVSGELTICRSMRSSTRPFAIPC